MLGKNLRVLGDRPLIVHTIDAARRAASISRVIVSTEAESIAEVARAHGADVPFLRPAALAGDDSPMIDVVCHALDWLRAEGSEPEMLVLLQPTVPFRTSDAIDEAVRALAASTADAAVTVRAVPAHYNPEWQLRLDGGVLERLDGQPLATLPRRRQELPVTYIRDGSIYAVKTARLRATGSLYGGLTIGLMQPAAAINIDTLDDWNLAEAVLARTNQARKGSA